MAMPAREIQTQEHSPEFQPILIGPPGGERESMIRRHDYLAVQGGRRYERHGGIEDLIQVARLGLVKAADRFDSDRGVPFHSWARIVIEGELKHYLRDKQTLIRRPRWIERKAAARTRAFGAPDGYSEGLYAQIAQPLSLDQELGREDQAAPLMSLIGADDCNIENACERLSLKQALAALAIREKQVLYMLYYMELTQSDVAERFKVSQMCISRMHRRAIGKLRSSLVTETEG